MPVNRPWTPAAILKAGLVGLLLAACLGSEWLHRAPLPGAFPNQILAEVFATVQAADIQWVVFLCVAIYFCGFGWLHGTIHRGGEFTQRAVWWLALALFSICALAYGMHYQEASRSTDPLLLGFGLALFLGVKLWRAANARRTQPFNIDLAVVTSLLLLLPLGSLFHPDPLQRFHYRGHVRWSGMWENPNTFGLLMGTGFVLAVGSFLLQPRLRHPAVASGGSPRGTAHPRTRTMAAAALCLVPAALCGLGLLRSYSRGAWVGTAIALCWLLWQWFMPPPCLRVGPAENPHPQGGAAPAPPGLRRSRMVQMAIILASLLVLSFWTFRHTEQRVVRRAFSVANINDFSWRNRVAAYVGSFQMMAAKPWFGYGWNATTQVYDQLFLPPKVVEWAAIRVNDYLSIGTSLGVPALLCLIFLVALSLRQGGAAPLQQGRGPAAATPPDLPCICRCALMVLVVGFWFEAGLFKLATSSLFWVLLALGSNQWGPQPAATAGSASPCTGPASGHAAPGRWAPEARLPWSSIRSAALWLSPLAGLLGAMAWAGSADPFQRIEFSLKSSRGETVQGMVVLPKPVGIHPVVIFLPDSPETLHSAGRELCTLAARGLAAVGLEYDQTAQETFDTQFIALLDYISHQPWAQPRATAWVGSGLAAERILRFALQHPEAGPQLLVCRSGGWLKELDGAGTHLWQGPAPRPDPPLQSRVNFPVLLVQGGEDEQFPAADCQRLADYLRQQGTPVDVRILPGVRHSWGEDDDTIVRGIGEYCAARLPLPDYAAGLPGCGLGPAEARRFNLAMSRAGLNRRELWKGVVSSHEPERHTLMNVIGGLEDYDLAHLPAARLRAGVERAWQARRKYPWCRDTPPEIFEKFVANPRIYEEPPGEDPAVFGPGPQPPTKYCHTAAGTSDAIGSWIHSRLQLRNTPAEPELPLADLMARGGTCREGAMIHAHLCRQAGLPARPVYVLWPTLGSWHWFTEVWSTDEQQWHAVDSANPDRPYGASWLHKVRKATTLATTGERGGWNALRERRWEAFTNTIGIHYPNGRVCVRVTDGDHPVRDARVVTQIWLKGEVVPVLATRTGQQGEAYLTLGPSALHPYRIVVEGSGDAPWKWLTVQSNRTCTVELDLRNASPFDKSADPPPLEDVKGEGAK